MSKLLTPKQVAQALQVSESSVKRWCDAGVIQADYTAGGHRRILVSSLLQFVRSTKHQLVEPAVVDMTVSGEISQIDQPLIDRFAASLLGDCETASRRILTELYLAGQRISVIADTLIAPAFCQIGSSWECGDVEVFQERRACEICHRAIHALRALLPEPPAQAPIAIGGAPADDPYSLATTMVELVLRDNQWQARSLGSHLPFRTFEAALKTHRPRLFWLSISHISAIDEFLEGYRSLYASRGDETAFVVGGQALTSRIRQQINYAAYCDNMQHLESFAHSIGQPSVPSN